MSVSLINGCGKTGHPHAKNTTAPLFYATHKYQFKMNSILKYTACNRKTSRGKLNIGIKLLDIGFGND